MGAERPLRIGLTGSIGMGKSETAKMFASLGVPVYDSDAAVHRLYDCGGAAVAPIAAAFPDSVCDGRVDRVALTRAITAVPDGFNTLERIVHPLVAIEQERFLAANRTAPMVVLDIPLLFETGAEAAMDVVVVVSAPAALQRARVLARPGMTQAKFDHILSRQIDDAEKCRRADYVVNTALGLDHARAQVKAIHAELLERI